MVDDRTLNSLRKGVVEGVTLALMRDREVYGRDLASTLVELGLISSAGTMYPVLGRLRESGKVETTWEQSMKGPPRRYYRLTTRGQEALDDFTLGWRMISNGVASVFSPCAQVDSTTTGEGRSR
ncbi:PadR family transcriptional regulator [Microbacterium protaetiae]|uniref:PadR family transcriptional regulator n=1 Tax=Microbacterium protaetiae TaxID=2509458 RepID=A0A4P6ECA4_9MICO|nr:PadR family transcriptional regulator [Microbacterium protaetiae]QAY58629.1 PadR family transcriptional regulator [Microbacterium protaetiae]